MYSTVFELVAKGLSNQDIGDVLSKLGLPDRVQAVLAWSRLRGHV